MNIRQAIGVFLVAVLGISPSLQAELNIEITQGMAGAVPIAVVSEADDVSSHAGISFEEIANIVRNDLRASGRFQPLRHNQRPKNISSTAIDHLAWQDMGVENLIIGNIEPRGPGRYTISFKLFDIFHNRAQAGTAVSNKLQQGEVVLQASANSDSDVLAAKTYHGITPDRFRALGHHISDVIYERLTGVRGAFSTQIAYVVVTEVRGRPHYRLEVADMDGYNPKTLVESKEPIMSPSWSPDGRNLAFVSFEHHRAEIFSLDVRTGQRKRLTNFPGINGAPAWSPDGQKMAVVLSKDGSPKVYVLDLASNQLEQMTRGYSIDTEPTWTQDGRSIYFTSNRGGRPQIYKVNTQNKRVARVTFNGEYNARPKITADGKYLVMIHRSKPGVFHIASQNLMNGELKILTDAKLDESPSLSPNGAMVLYGTKQSQRRVLGLVTIDGRGHLRLPAREGSVQEPAWSPFLS
jgi:TolB protein